MKFRIRNYSVILILGSAICAASSYASQPKQYFPATEEPPSEEVISSAPGYRGNEAAPTGIVTEESIPEPVQQEVALPPPPAPAAPVAARRSETQRKAHFDAVPASQTQALIRRLQITEALVAKYGRAYDYRSLTVGQLTAVLGDLDGQATQKAELRQRIGSRAELKKEVQEDDEYIPAPTE